MPHDPMLTKADIFTVRHRYSGMVKTSGYRLADMLNDPSTEVLEIRDVAVSQPINARSGSVECSQLLLKKDSILIALPTGSYEAPARRLYSFVEKHHYTAQVVVPGHTMVGTVHLPSRASPWILMSEGGTEPSFMAMTDVTVHFAEGDVEPVHSKVIIFRRQAIESLFLSERPQSDGSLVDAAATLRDPDALDLAKLLADIHGSADDRDAARESAASGHADEPEFSQGRQV